MLDLRIGELRIKYVTSVFPQTTAFVTREATKYVFYDRFNGRITKMYVLYKFKTELAEFR